MNNLNIDYENIIEQIEGKEFEFIKVFMISKIATKPKNIEFIKGPEKSILKFDLGIINSELIITKKQNQTVEIQYKKGLITATVMGTSLVILMHFFNDVSYKELAITLIILWIGLPTIISLQETYLSKKYSNRIRDHFETMSSNNPPNL
jgi:hypothetical protein